MLAVVPQVVEIALGDEIQFVPGEFAGHALVNLFEQALPVLLLDPHFCGPLLALRLFLRAELRSQSSGDFCRQLALQSDRILQCAIVTVRPDLPFGRCVGQLHINQHAICSATNATLENGSNAKLLCERAEPATGKIPI